MRSRESATQHGQDESVRTETGYQETEGRTAQGGTSTQATVVMATAQKPMPLVSGNTLPSMRQPSQLPLCTKRQLRCTKRQHLCMLSPSPSTLRPLRLFSSPSTPHQFRT